MKAEAEIEEDRERCRNDFAYFCERAWHVIDPGTPFIRDYAFEAICEYYQAWVRDHFDYWVLFAPPGTGKSRPFSIAGPAWIWMNDPTAEKITASSSNDLCIDFSERTRDLISSPWFQERWGLDVVIADRQKDGTGKDTSRLYKTKQGGMRLAIPLGGSRIGFRARWVLLDDPMSYDEAHSAVESARRWNKIRGEVIKRMNDRPDKPGKLGCAMQRLAKGDTGDRLKEYYGNRLEILKLQTRYVQVPRMPWELDADRYVPTVRDPRTVPGELLAPLRVSEDQVQIREAHPYDFAAQDQQEPIERDNSERRIQGFTALCHAESAGSEVTNDPRDGWLFGLGFDHGELAGHEVCFLVAWHEARKKAWICDEYVSRARMAYGDHAPYIRDMVENRNALSLRRLGHCVGDINSAGTSAGESVNQVIGKALDGLIIHKPDKRAGMHDEGVTLIDLALRSGALKVDRDCKHLIDALNMWSGKDDQWKHCIDAALYILTPILRRFVWGEGGAISR